MPHRRSDRGEAHTELKKILAKAGDKEEQLHEILIATDYQAKCRKEASVSGLFIADFPAPHRYLKKTKWLDEFPSRHEIEEKKQAKLCACGQEAGHKRGNVEYCGECLSKMIGEESGSTERLREGFKKLPPRLEGESSKDWASRIQSQISAKYGIISK